MTKVWTILTNANYGWLFFKINGCFMVYFAWVYKNILSVSQGVSRKNAVSGKNVNFI